MARPKLKWNKQNEYTTNTWNDIPYFWNTRDLITRAGKLALDPYRFRDRWKKETTDLEKEQFIELILYVEDKIITDKKKKRKREDIEVSVDDVRMVSKEILGIDIIVENIKIE